MQRIFEKWLLLYTLIACVISFGLSIHAETKLAQKRARLLIAGKINDTQKIILADETEVNGFLNKFVDDVYAKVNVPDLKAEKEKEIKRLHDYWYDDIRDRDLRNFVRIFRIGATGEIVVCRNGKIIGSVDEGNYGKTLSCYHFSQTLPQPMKKFYPVIKGERTICLYNDFGEYRILGFMSAKEMYANCNSTAIGLISFHLVLFVTAYILMVLLVRNVIIKGIYQVNRSLEKITRGDLGETVEVKTNREMTLLSNGINTMLASLRAANAEREAQINRELDLGRTIQKSSLPATFPAFPDRREFEIHASMEAAKEVGGDFYDFFLCDSNPLCVVIGDVSGKGIPAALFMMRTKDIIKNLALSGSPLTEICDEANKQLFENNVTGMFVTAFVAMLEIDTGRLVCVNAGHNPPLLVKQGGNAEWLEAQGGFMLGVLDQFGYRQSEVQMEPGETLYIYTDGVTEAFNTGDEMFGNARLQALLATESTAALTPAELLGLVKKDLAAYTQGAHQSDDITMLALRYAGPRAR